MNAREFLIQELSRGYLTKQQHKEQFPNTPYNGFKLIKYDYGMSTDRVIQIMDKYHDYLIRELDKDYQEWKEYNVIATGFENGKDTGHVSYHIRDDGEIQPNNFTQETLYEWYKKNITVEPMTEDQFINIIKLHEVPMTSASETTWRYVWRNRNNPDAFKGNNQFKQS